MSSKKQRTKSEQPIDIGDSLAFGVVFALILTVAQRVIGFVRGIALCRVMSEEELGLWSLAFSFLMLLGPLAVLGLPGTFGRFVEHYRLKGELSHFLKKMTVACAITTLLLSTTLWILAKPLAELLFSDPSQNNLVVALGFSLLTVVLVNFVSSALEALRYIRLVTWIRFSSGVVFSVISLVAVLAISPSATVVTYCFSASCVIGLLPAVWFICKSRQPANLDTPRISSSIWKKIAPYAAWMWVVNIAANCFEMADRYMLLKLAPGGPSIGQAWVGQYHSSRVVPLLFVGVATMLAGVLMPYLTSAWEQNKHRQILKQMDLTVKLSSVGFTLCGCMVLLIAPWLFTFVLQGRYDAGLQILPVTLVYCTWYGMFLVAENFLWLKGKGRLAFVAILAGLVINVVCNWLLIPVYGLYGAVLATGFANLVCLIVLSVFNRQSGWPIGFQYVFYMMLPGLLIAPVSIVIAFVLVLLFAVWKTDFALDSQERAQLSVMFEKLLAKFGFKRRTDSVTPGSSASCSNASL